MTAPVLAALADALAFGDTLIIVRSSAAVAEVPAGPLRRGGEWLTLGDEGAGAAHVHVKVSAIHALRFRHAAGHNAALDLLDARGESLCSLAFRKTNPGRAEAFDPERTAAVRARFAHLGEASA